MRGKRIHIVLLMVLVSLLIGQSAMASSRTSIPSQPYQTSIDQPLPPTATMDRIDVSLPVSPYTVLVRSRRSLVQITQPVPLCHAQCLSSRKEQRRDLYRWCMIWYGKLGLPKENISFPFHAFW